MGTKHSREKTVPKTMTEKSNLTERREPVTELGGRTDYERDYTAILYSHAFRRLKHKTQVFYFPINDHICTRLDHSLYVASTSSIICRCLDQNGIDCEPTLASAIGLGHDLGHAPFGHAGQDVLNNLAKAIGGFSHETQGLRIIDKIEKPRDTLPIIGLNLTLAVRDGIVNHCGESRVSVIMPSDPPSYDEVGSTDVMPCTIEGCVVRLVDKVSYLGRDIEDAIIAEFIKESDLPAGIRAKIGSKNGEIVEYFVKDIIASTSTDCVRISEEAADLMLQMDKYNYEYIYKIPRIINYFNRLAEMLEILFDKLIVVIGEKKDNIAEYTNGEPDAIGILGDFISNRHKLYFCEEIALGEEKLYMKIVTDFISTLTDRWVFDAFTDIFLPRPLV